MKMRKATRIFVVLSIIFVLCPRGLTQSSFNADNYVAGALDAPVFDAEGNRLFGANYVAVLYGGPTPDSLVPARGANVGLVMTPAPFTFIANGQPGYYRAETFVQIPNVDCGGLAWLQVRVWDTRLGGTYESVAELGQGGYGESNLFQRRGGNNCLVPPAPVERLVGLQSFSLHPVPEPSTWTLLACGGLALWWTAWRQRRRS